MGKRGRRPQPTKLKIARGNPGKRPLNSREPEPPADKIEPPDYLAGKSLEKWHQLVGSLEEMGMLTNVDVESLARYCTLHEQFLRYLDQVRRGLDVMVIKNDAGKVKFMQVGPAATLLSKTATAMLRLEQEFGLTPSSRSGIQVGNGTAKDNNPLKAFGITG